MADLVKKISSPYSIVSTSGDTIVSFGNSALNNASVTISGNVTAVSTLTDNLVLNASLASNAAPTSNAAITVNRGTSADVVIQWNEAVGAWQLSNDGSTFDNITTASGISGVASFNTRTGAVALTSNDVVTALNYTPPPLDGTDAYGTWGIDISGSAATVSNAAQPTITSLGTLTSLDVLGDSIMTGNLIIAGNLTILGNETVINSENLVVTDSMIYLALDNPSDILTIGIVADYYDVGAGGNVHTGLIRDNITKDYYLFKDYLPHPANNTFDINDVSFALTNLHVNTLTGNITGNVTGNITGNATNVTGVVSISNGGTGLSSIGANTYVLTSDGVNASWEAPVGGGGSASIPYVVATGTGDALIATFSPAITAYTDGMLISVKAPANNTGAATINVNGLGIRPIEKELGNGLNAGDLGITGIALLEYNSSNVGFIMVNPQKTSAYRLFGVTLNGVAPSTGQVLTATSTTAANWQTLSSNSISQLNSSVTVTDTGTDGNVVVIVDGVSAMNITSSEIATELPITYKGSSASFGNVITTIDSFSASLYRTAKYIISVTNGSTYQSAEVLVTHNGITAYDTSYAVVSSTGTPLATFSSTYSSGNVLLQATGTTVGNTAKIQKIYIVV